MVRLENDAFLRQVGDQDVLGVRRRADVVQFDRAAAAVQGHSLVDERQLRLGVARRLPHDALVVAERHDGRAFLRVGGGAGHVVAVVMRQHPITDRFVGHVLAQLPDRVRHDLGAADGHHVVVHLDEQRVGVVAADQEHALVDFLAAEFVRPHLGDLPQRVRHLHVTVQRRVDLRVEHLEFQVGLAVHVQLELLGERDAADLFVVEEGIGDLPERRQHALHVGQHVALAVEVQRQARPDLHDQRDDVVRAPVECGFAQPVRGLAPRLQLLDQQRRGDADEGPRLRVEIRLRQRCGGAGAVVELPAGVAVDDGAAFEDEAAAFAGIVADEDLVLEVDGVEVLRLVAVPRRPGLAALAGGESDEVLLLRHAVQAVERLGPAVGFDGGVDDLVGLVDGLQRQRVRRHRRAGQQKGGCAGPNEVSVHDCLPVFTR